MKLEKGTYLVKKEDFEQFKKDADEGGIRNIWGESLREYFSNGWRGYHKNEIVFYYGTDDGGFDWDYVEDAEDYTLYKPNNMKMETSTVLTFDEVADDCKQFGIILNTVSWYGVTIWKRRFKEEQTALQFNNQKMFCRDIILKYLELTYNEEPTEKKQLKAKIDDLQEQVEQAKKKLEELD